MKVCAFLTDGFETVEALAVVDILRRADIKTDVISITGDINVKSAQGVIVQADELLDEYVFEGDELLFLPGGPGHIMIARIYWNFLKNTIRRITELQPYVQHLRFWEISDFLMERKQWHFLDLKIS